MKQKTPPAPPSAPEPKKIVTTGEPISLPIGQYIHPGGCILEIAPAPQDKTVIVRVQGTFDFFFVGNRPVGFATVANAPQPLLVPSQPPPPKLEIVKH